MAFVLAKRGERPLRIALAGVGGTGKTLTSLFIARRLAGKDGKVAVIDTENESARLYAEKVEGSFHVNSLVKAGPVEMVAAMDEAQKLEPKVLIIDSSSAEWQGPGGCLEMADSLGKFKGWASVTPLHNAFLSGIQHFPGHVILTVRRKPDYQVSSSGAPKKIGLAWVQRDSLIYEVDIGLNMEGSDIVTVEKSRLDAPLLQDATLKRGDLPELFYAAANR